MNYFILKSGEGFDWIWSKEVELKKYTLNFKGKPIKNSWKVLEVDYVDEGKRDFDICSATSPMYFFSKKATIVLKNILLKHGEFLDVKSPNDNYTAYHCTDIVDALDFNNSQIDWLDKERSWIHNITHYTFKKNEIIGKDVFRIPEVSTSITFFSENFKKLVEKNNFLGVEFQKIKASYI